MLLTVFCIHHSCKELGSYFDIPISRKIIGFHRKALKKITRDQNIGDEDPTAEEWATLVDKGCQAMCDYMRKRDLKKH